ncbi:MAG TPA: hypothetical protein ENI79_03155 [Rhodospirillales bacterium]|nr:hypothetical protein [Rhodospirillales bacterium]
MIGPAMFTNIEALDSSKHGNLLFKPVSNYAFAAGVSSAPISVTEIVEAAKYYPVSFALEEPLLPIALLSLKGPPDPWTKRN